MYTGLYTILFISSVILFMNLFINLKYLKCDFYKVCSILKVIFKKILTIELQSKTYLHDITS